MHCKKYISSNSKEPQYVKQIYLETNKKNLFKAQLLLRVVNGISIISLQIGTINTLTVNLH